MDWFWWVLFAAYNVLLIVGFVEYLHGRHRVKVAIWIATLPVSVSLAWGADGITFAFAAKVVGVSIEVATAHFVVAGHFLLSALLELGMSISAVLEVPERFFTHLTRKRRVRIAN